MICKFRKKCFFEQNLLRKCQSSIEWSSFEKQYKGTKVFDSGDL